MCKYGAIARYCVKWHQSQKNKKLGAKCKEGCDGRVYVSWSENKDYFVVKVVSPTHTCDIQDFQNV